MFERFTLNERLQHFVLLLSFTVLMITGFSLMFPISIWTTIIIRFLGGFYWRGIIHRIAALVFIGLSVYHFCYLLLTRRGREQFRELLPGWYDFRDFLQMIRYYVGLEKARPKFGRYSYPEKAEYWALVWGSIVMIVTGLLLWGMAQTIGAAGKLAFDIARVIHGYEAILAALALIVFHFYNVHLNPDDFLFKNLTWLNGKISREKMEKEHPLELEKLENR